ncbi:MAG: NAD-dependent epimerase/dehydratase family protein [Rhodoferax sp.]|uniref:NAD-dependent epimerase/dehydratase family protein n=1 Tax=Rhodoferax sp. TaxID=50421 RepID=UPI0014014960|nr:NAD-dependent epimerase/dehydratase family protein [Rhodoferax sp.]NDP39369.1 NAD-dependent epimerase/dehydratase family protein [Rhodoferax sp.]
MNTQSTIYIAGHQGLVGSAILQELLAAGHAPETILTRTHAELDLTNQAAVQAFFAAEKPAQVYLAAAKAGGIHANSTYPADLIYQNLMIQGNLMEAAYQNGVQKLMFFAPSADTLPLDALALSDDSYAFAKTAGIKLCEEYASRDDADYRYILLPVLSGHGVQQHDGSHVDGIAAASINVMNLPKASYSQRKPHVLN